MKRYYHQQNGSTLIEVLVAVLILSFGMLALGGMLSYAVQLPKLSGYRSAAAMIAASHIDRMRANTKGFAAGSYDMAATTYNNSLPADSACAYPSCVASDIATRDIRETNVALRNFLPGGSASAGVGAGMQVKCNAPCSNLEGNLWVIWDEPSTTAALDATSSEECPTTGLSAASAGVPRRCIVMRFKL
jgi:type IV pilus assembly protein PilV